MSKKGVRPFEMSESDRYRLRAVRSGERPPAGRQGCRTSEPLCLQALARVLAAGFFLGSLWPTLTGCAASLPSEAFPSSRFVLHSESDPQEIHEVRLQAESFLDDLESYLDLKAPPGGLLKIVHFRHRVDLWAYLGEEIPEFRWRKGVCFEKADSYVLALSGRPQESAFRKTLRHELTHYFLIVHFSEFPPWIDEGLAQVLAAGSPFPEPGRPRADPAGRAGTGSAGDCLKLLQKRHGEKLVASEYKLARILAAGLISRSGDSLARLVRFLELSAADREPSRVFREAWGLSFEEACAELTASKGL